MAARIRKQHQPWRFYVYLVTDAGGAPLYVGKGSGKRMFTSLRERGGASVCQLACFYREEDAYRHEVECIRVMSPKLNILKGGNGSKASPVKKTRWKFDSTVSALGTRKFAARLWMAALSACNRSGNIFPGDLSKLENIREVAYG